MSEPFALSGNTPRHQTSQPHHTQQISPHAAQQSRNIPARGRGSRGGRSRGRGSIRNTQPSSRPSEQTDFERPPGLPPNGDFGIRLTKAASQIQGDLGVTETETEEKPIEGEDTEQEVCFICASPIEHTSISPCNHQTCHICALRLRALYKTKACAHCRSEAEYVIFTDSKAKRYEDFVDQTFAKVEHGLGIKFENTTIHDDTILLLRYNCPDKDCDVQCLSWPDLNRHVRGKHDKVLCDLCTRNKKVFTHEHELFTYAELRKHQRFGDDNPGAIDQSGFKGHPECGFCKQRFYGDDELYTHCRERHERCHICDRRDPGQHPQYYLNYQELEKHFQEAHFVCLDAECQANKTNVFESEMDLKAHQLSEHPNGLSKDARRDARLVNLSGFDLRTPYQAERRERRDNRPGARGRDPNTEPLPASSAQPIGRAEQAYQRQMALMSGPTSSGRPFGGQLTQPPPSPRPQNQQPRQAQRSRPASPPPQPPNLDTLKIDSEQSSNTIPNTPQEAARASRHAAVTSRATSLFAAPTAASSTEAKLTQFRTLISRYRNSEITATTLVDTFVGSLFASSTTSSSPAELGKLIRELADLFEVEPKRQALLEAWNNWRSVNDASDYPSLPGMTASSSSSSTGVASGRRVLRLKSSTAQSGRSASNRQGAWSGQPVTAASALSSNPFPSLSAGVGAGKKTTPSSNVWGPAKPPPAQPLAVAMSNAAASRSSSRPMSTATSGLGPATNEAFPSLPRGAKPSFLMAGLHRGTVRWEDKTSNPSSGTSTPMGSAWGAGGTNPTPAQASMALQNVVDGKQTGNDSAVDGPSGNKRGKKKEKKQVLYHFG